MGQLLVKQAGAVDRLYLKAREKITKIISAVTAQQLLDNPEGTLKSARELAVRSMTPLIKESFVQGRIHAYEVLRAMKVTEVPRDSGKLNDEEKAKLNELLTVWNDDMRAQNIDFAVMLKRWKRILLATEIDESSKIDAATRDWNSTSNTGRPNGRWTSTWKNGVPANAAEFINFVEQAGWEAGFLGLGQKV